VRDLAGLGFYAGAHRVAVPGGPPSRRLRQRFGEGADLAGAVALVAGDAVPIVVGAGAFDDEADAVAHADAARELADGNPDGSFTHGAAPHRPRRGWGAGARGSGRRRTPRGRGGHSPSIDGGRAG